MGKTTREDRNSWTLQHILDFLSLSQILQVQYQLCSLAGAMQECLDL